jgi:CheY-like chemotaxis protein
MTCATNFLPEQHLRAIALDDDANAVRDVRRALEGRRFSVLSAADGTAGLALLVDELLGLDVLVLDADLPGRDARSFADLIRRAGGETELAIVVVASDPTGAVRAELLAVGVDAVVDRSAGSEAVADVVEDVVARRRAGEVPPEAFAAQATPPARDPRWTLPMAWSTLPAWPA